MQALLLDPSFYDQHAERIHDLFAEHVKNLDVRTGGRPELDATPFFRVLHHIIPRFDGGGDEESNRVTLHQYEHALIHLFRYSWKKDFKDLNAFSSACLTQDQIERRNRPVSQNSLRAWEKTTRNPEWQKEFGSKGLAKRVPPVSSSLQRRKAAEAAKQTQWQNSRQRVNPFTWFLCDQELAFENVNNSTQGSSTIVWIFPNQDPKQRTVTNIAEILTNHPIHNTTNSPIVAKEKFSNFAEIFRGERNMKWGWKFHALRIQNQTYLLKTSEDLLQLKVALRGLRPLRDLLFCCLWETFFSRSKVRARLERF